MTLDRGRKNVRLLVQPQYSPMPVGEQVAVLYCGTHALMAPIQIAQVGTFQEMFLERMRASHAAILDELGAGRVPDKAVAAIEKTAREVCEAINATEAGPAVAAGSDRKAAPAK